MQNMKTGYFQDVKKRWNDNIKMVIKEMGREDVGWIQLTHDIQLRDLVNTVMKLLVL
jgi:hypothetical protein